ncbi:biopolymer transporter ExbD [Pelagicoccus sp. SDUM812003]|uniref:ExbD/TolR family protein n=1 Tax=Pelagicoccus sp. SDUM812003 TaxID=3041267 RepID=UPI00280EC044|nr:biopolymer transporter ExbD [Pelagicoccus sp. SDUM812003]MDQ8203239.1 biopolymer transporter ExbD [Pelagicoccus sp. SDUM812003]
MAVRIRNRKRSRGIAGVSMAPMIDMVFLLLVFFMTASAMSQAGSKLELDLPESPSSEVPKDLSHRFILSIDSQGRYFLGGKPLAEEELDQLLVRFRQETPAAKLRIRAAKDTPFLHIKSAMKRAAEAGVEHYLYATYQGEG